MLLNINTDRIFILIQYILSGSYILVFLRFLVFLLDIDFYLSNDFQNIAEYLINFKATMISITNPFMILVNKLFYLIFGDIDIDLINIMGPIFLIIVILMLKIILKMITPHIKYYARKYN